MLDIPRLEAVLVNCCSPLSAGASVAAMRAAAPDHVKVGAYANGFRVTTDQWQAGAGGDEGCYDVSEDFDEHGAVSCHPPSRFPHAWLVTMKGTTTAPRFCVAT